jgi:hypothetical protein
MTSIFNITINLLTTTLVVLILQGSVSAQNTPSNISSGGFNPSTATEIADFVPDSTTIDFYTLVDIDNITPYVDTLFQDFEKYAINRRFRTGTLTLGNQASAAQQIIYSSRDDINTDMGFHQYDNYRRNIYDFPIYEANRTFNDLYFSPSNGSENFIVGAKFARSFSDNIELSIDYNRTKEDGVYRNQGTKATQLGIAISREGKAKRHRLLVAFAANNFNEIHNGGVTYASDGVTRVDLYSTEWNTGEIRNQRLSVPVTTTTTPGSTRHQSFTYGVDNYLKIDSNRFQLHHHIDLEHGYYLYSDDDATNINDTLLYGAYLTDSRGLRHLNKFTKLSNQFDVGIHTSTFFLNVGVEYRFLNYDNSISSEQYHDAAAIGNIGLNIKKLTSLNAEVAFGIGENIGNFKIKPVLKIYGLKGMTIEANLKLLRYDPTIIQQRAVITDMIVYDNEFSKINEFVIGGKLAYKKLNLDIEVNSGVIDNPVYFGTDALPAQSSSTQFLQVMGTHRLQWKFIGVENSVAFQDFSDNIYHLPRVYSIHKLYLQSYLFRKRLLTQFGVLYYNYNFDGNLKFMPANGQFYQTEETFRPYYYSELFANFKVDKFRVFIKMDNFTDILRKEPHYQIVDYPQYDATLRLGVRWQLFE